MNKVELYITSVHNDLRPIVEKLRETIKGISQDFKEEIKWNALTYSINKDICSIMAHQKHVNLQIFRGANIKDSDFLQGTGKNMRHLKFENLSDIDINVVKLTIKQAIALDAA